MEIPATRAKLLEALSLADESSRNERAKRIEWLAQHISDTPAFTGEMATMHMMQEARLCFVSGQFIGALLLATSFVEQTLSEELAGVTTAQERRTLELLIKSARDRLRYPRDLLDRTDRLRELRNPFTHRKAPDHVHALGTRFLAVKVHPATILEEDAKLAIGVMYEWFRRTLRSG